MVMAASGRVRTLVPFFIPGEGNTVNEALSTFPSDELLVSRKRTSRRKSAPPRGNNTDLVSVNVRKWDSSEGFFRDAVHVIEDFHHSASAFKSSSYTSSPSMKSTIPSETSFSPQPPSSSSSPPSPSPSPVHTPAKGSLPKPTQISINFTPMSSSPSPARVTPARPPRHRTPPFVNRSLSASPPPSSVSMAASPQLLTPANIRKAQTKTRHSAVMSLPSSPPTERVKSKAPSASVSAIDSVMLPIPSATQHQFTGPISLDIASGTLSSSSQSSIGKPSVSQRSKSMLDSSTPELKRRPWAGSSFDIASPAPAFIPIPAFKTSTPSSSSIARRLSDVDDFHPEQEFIKLASVLRL